MNISLGNIADPFRCNTIDNALYRDIQICHNPRCRHRPDFEFSLRVGRRNGAYPKQAGNRLKTNKL